MKNFLWSLILTSMALALAGCGREYQIQGKVVLFPGRAGSITEVTGQPMPEGGLALAGAEVRMYFDLDKQGRPVADMPFRASSLTNEDGTFTVRDYAEPSRKKKIGIEVVKQGYKTIYATYIDDISLTPQIFWIVSEPV